jgi:excisionase family DNA binding protein
MAESRFTNADMQFLTVADLAKMFAVKPPTVRMWIRTGRIAAIKIGRDYRVSEMALEKFIAPESVGRERDEG